ILWYKSYPPAQPQSLLTFPATRSTSRQFAPCSYVEEPAMAASLVEKRISTPQADSDLRRVAADSIDEALCVFNAVRSRLFGVAYRLLGSAADAEDIVQSVWLKWQMKDRSVVRDATAFLTTAAVRLAVNVAHSAHARRESYVGPWLPEPVDTS